MFLAVGGVLLGYSRYWRHYAHRIEGRIVGVDKRDAFYFPIYHYVLGGKDYQVTSNTSYSAAPDMQPGRVVPLMVLPDKPETATPTNSYVVEIVAATFIMGSLIGFVVISTAFGGATRLTMFALAALVGRWAFQLAWNFRVEQNRGSFRTKPKTFPLS